MIPINPVTVGKAGVKILTALAPTAINSLIKHLGKEHGSKVKAGAYEECPISTHNNKACIIVKGENGIITLTDETIESCYFIKKKYKIARGKNYYYFDINFRDGQKSKIRISKKYRDALREYTTILSHDWPGL